MLKHKKLLIAALFACMIGSLGAQTNSPYSRYGYGVLNDQTTGVSKGLGGLKYGIRNSLSANSGNPASYSKVDSLTFLFDLGVSVNSAKLSDRQSSRSDWNGGLDYITILFPVSKTLGISAGILPTSTVGYDFGSSGDIAGIGYKKTYEGEGGLSQLYLGAGYDLPLKGLSVGVNVSYLFGNLKHTSALTSIGNGGGIGSPGFGSTLTFEDTELKISTFKFDIGLQYDWKLNKDNTLSLGAVYSPQINSKAKFNRYTTEISSSTGQKVDGDTLTLNKENAGMPHSIGFGGALYHTSQWMAGADFTYQKWKSVKYTHMMGDGLNNSDRFNNTWKLNFGGEYSVDPYSRNFFKKVKLRGGFNVGNSYMNVKSTTGQLGGYNEFGASIGFGLPLSDAESLGYRTSYLNLSFEYKNLSPKIKSMVKERYFIVSLGVNLNELWFYKRKIQ